MEETSSRCIYCQNISKPSHKPPRIFCYVWRAKPLTSYKAKSAEFSRLPLPVALFLFPCWNPFSTWRSPSRPRPFQIDTTCPHRPAPSPPSFVMCNPPGTLIPPTPHFPLILKWKTHLSPTEVDESSELSAWLSWAAQTLPHSPGQGMSCRWQGTRILSCGPARLGPSILGRFLPYTFFSYFAACSHIVFIFYRHLAEVKQPRTSLTF